MIKGLDMSWTRIVDKTSHLMDGMSQIWTRIENVLYYVTVACQQQLEYNEQEQGQAAQENQ